jgi:hypothetical protein
MIKKEKKKRRKVDEGKIIFDINGVNECGNNNIKYHVATLLFRRLFQRLLKSAER